MKFEMNESKRMLSDIENKFFQDVFTCWKDNPVALCAEWDESIIDFCEEQGITIEFLNPILNDYNANQIHLLMAKGDNGSQAACFFRHFRNAFAHGHIFIITPGELIMAFDGDVKKLKKGEDGNQAEVFEYKMRCLCPYIYFRELTFRLLNVGEQRFKTIG